MGFAVAEQRSATDETCVELPSAAAAADRIAAGCLTDAPLGRVGLEIEAHCFDPADVHRRPGWDEIGAVLRGLPALPGGSVVTVEPGGAVELSSPPVPGAVAAIAAMAADRAVLCASFARAGLGLVTLGADPLRPPHRINPGERYRAMETFFAASRTGSVGAAMMTSTASIQVNLDAGPAAGWAARVRLAHALGPTMVAITANSPLLSGESSGWRSTRQRIWSRLDAARCGPILSSSGAGPAEEWARYALKAPVMLVRGADSRRCTAVTEHVPFADWADGRVLLDGRRPTAADLDYHLTTLFPPVRPRGWLEIRYLDSVDDALWPAIVFTLTTLLDDPTSAERAADAVAPVAGAWDVAARVGLADERIHAAARRCVAIAAEQAPPSLAEPMAALAARVQRGHCPADDVAAEAAATGIAATVARLARGQR